MTRWHRDVAVEHLQTLYEFWRNPAKAPPQLIDEMLYEQEEFAAGYHPRLIRLHGGSAFKDLQVRLQMAAIEFWPTFRLGRAIKRWATE